MALTIGIVGLPNAGKSTLFNALTKNNVLAANYPFATIEPNVGVVPIPDPRLRELPTILPREGFAPQSPHVVRARPVEGGGRRREALARNPGRW